MKKIFKYFIAVVTLFTFITKVNAAGATISVNTSASQIIVGNNITVTVTISSSSPLGSWEYNLNYDNINYIIAVLHKTVNRTKHRIFNIKFIQCRKLRAFSV